MVVADSCANVRVFQYAPTADVPYQQGTIDAGGQANFNRRLLCTASFHLGQQSICISRHTLLRQNRQIVSKHAPEIGVSTGFSSLICTTAGSVGILCHVQLESYTVRCLVGSICSQE